jgi:hypothetical protein
MNKMRTSRCAGDKLVGRGLLRRCRSKSKTIAQQRQTRDHEAAMKCEICRLIQKLGLGKSAHELWLCTDKQLPRRGRRVAVVDRMGRRASKSFA